MNGRSLRSATAADRDAERPELAVAPLDELVARTGNNRPLIVELIEIFESECHTMLAELHRGLLAQDGKAVQGAAHRLRGSLRIFGARRAIEVLTELESMGREGVLERAPARLSELEHAAHDALIALRTYRSRLTEPVVEH